MAIIRRKGSEFVVEVNDKVVHKGSDQKAVEMWAEKHYDSVRYMNSSPFETGRQRVQNQLAEQYPQFFQNAYIKREKLRQMIKDGRAEVEFGDVDGRVGSSITVRTGKVRRTYLLED